MEPKWKGLPNPRAPCSARMGTKGVQDAEEGCPRSGRGRPCGWCAFLASGAQVKPFPSRALTLPTLFRNCVPETGRAAGREARSVPASFPFESPCGISFRTVRKSEREPVGCSAAPGRLPHRGWRLTALGRRSRRARGGVGGPGASPADWGVKIAANSRCTRHQLQAFQALSLILPSHFTGEEPDAERLGNLLKVTQRGFKVTVCVNPKSRILCVHYSGDIEVAKGLEWTSGRGRT